MPPEDPRPNKPGKTDRFGALKSILIASILTVVLLSGYSIFFLSPSFTALIAENTQTEALRAGRHIAESLFISGETISRESIDESFPKELNEVTSIFEMIKIKVFAPDGEIVYSTTPSEIGKYNQISYFHEVVAKGSPYTKIVKKDSKTLEGQIISTDVVEAYVPIMHQSTFLGAFEIYYDITRSKAKLDRLIRLSNIMLLTIAMALLLAVAFISVKARKNIIERQRAEEMILRQSAELTEINSDLSVLNQISSVISHSIDINELLPSVLKTINRKLHPLVIEDRTCIFTVNGRKMELAVMTGQSDDFLSLHTEMTIDDCLCGQAARTGEIVISNNSASDGNHTICCGTDRPHGHIIIPMKAANRVVGVLNIFTPIDLRVESKMHLFESIGNQLGVALENAKLYSEAKRLSLHDPLTGLANRRFMEKNLEQSMAQAQRYGGKLSACMLDIDYFKKYNDTFGHAAGDQLLIRIAGIISGLLRHADLAARYGGEEFMLILPEADITKALVVAERIRRTIEEETDITISIGVASFKKDSTPDQLTKAADDALYLAKQNGRNRVQSSDDPEATDPSD